ncbi:MAG TPA: MMPL family transporter [Syntrophorhabdaceae bacterium]|nr:MMPL family transporter [Syntrophorhabdaceae bacterium]
MGFSFFGNFYNVFSRRRLLLYGIALVVIIAAGLILRNISMNEDIAPLLPDDNSEAARDFELLQKAPFADKVLVSLHGETANKQTLIKVTDDLTKTLAKPYFTDVVSGPAITSLDAFPQWLMHVLPNTFTEKDQANVDAILNREQVRKRLQNSFEQLSSQEGMVLKPLIQADPLDFKSLMYGKLSHTNIVPGMQLYKNHFMSSDGKNTLIIARTPVKITDSKESKDMVAELQRSISHVLPAGVTASTMSAHAYTLANAESIKSDLALILGCSSVAIFLLIMYFLRSWKGVLVFLVPSSVLCLATAGALLIYDSVSAVTIAFGSVLLGISDDYPILVYFALSRKERDPALVIGNVARPVLFGGLTTLVTFSIMLLSNLPGQRQLAVFCMIGVAVSLIFSLLLLPQLLQGLPGEKRYFGNTPQKRIHLPRKTLIGCWIIVSVFCIWQATRLQFNGDLKIMNHVPETMKKTEQYFASTWGNFQDNAILFSEGESPESSLQVNDAVFKYFADTFGESDIISLAPLFPSEKTMASNRQRWDQFWMNGRANLVKKLIAEEGDKLGFSVNAFALFFDSLQSRKGALTMNDLDAVGLGELYNSLVIKQADRTLTMSLVPDSGDVIKLFTGDRPNKPEGVRLVSQGRFRRLISEALVQNLVRYIIFALVVIIASLGLLFRNLKKTILALVPVETGLFLMLGAMGFFGIQFNLFNVVATILVIGLGVDLGIFMVCNLTEGYEHTATLGILLGGLTSLVGLGALALARHPAIHSIGITVLLGLCGVIPSALLVVPALYGGND